MAIVSIYDDGGGSGTSYQDYIGSPMIVTGGEITDGTNAGTFQVAALTALLRATDSATGVLTYVTKTAQDNIAITLADTLYYVVLNYNAGTPTISLITVLGDFNNKISIGSVMKDASNNVYYISGCHRLQDGVARLHFRGFEVQRLYLTEGNAIAYSGTNNFTLTSGVVYEGINRITQTAYDSAVTTFIPVYQDGSGGWTEGAARNTIDFAHYDDDTPPLGNVGVNKYSVHWVFRHVDDDAAVYVLYGRDSYTLAEAEVSDVPTKPDHFTNFSCLLGRIVAPQAGGSFTSIHMITDTRFIGQAVATHNDLGGLNDGDYQHLTAAEKAVFDGAYKTIYIDAAEFVPCTTNGALQGTYEEPTNDIDLDVFLFEGGATPQRIMCKYKFEENWDRGVIIGAKFDWNSEAGSTAGDTVEWRIKMGAVGDSDAIDTALGTRQVISDTLLADSGADWQISPKTPNITVAGSPAKGDAIFIEIDRNGPGADTMAEKARFQGVTLQIKLSGAVVLWT